ncbi:MAG: pyruvate:ferredoxin (flavodoxin) oxidoreductase [Clostridiales bacterium]|nr:MAG: pyruvate:ferredoxin (flavodoxin) oxidoreductase [Clostridiales bacterium]
MARKMKTMDGNNAAAHVSYAFTEVAAIYPITPSSVMAEVTDAWSAKGQKNIFGQEVKVAEMQSEAGAAGAVHGSLSAGALTTTYTASQGLLLMIPNMYKIAGELLPNVIHVSARALATHALSIFGDHSDVMACRQTGYAMLASSNVQEVMDLGAVAHLSTIKGRVPFLHFFDGFRTSHEIQKIEAWDYEDLKEMVDMDAIKEYKARSLNPEHPVLRGSAQNPDIFFQAKEASNEFYTKIVDVTEDYMNKVNAKTGKNYHLFDYYGAPDADKVIIAMGSVCDTAEETIDYLLSKGEKVGLIKVRLYRPFSVKHLLSVIPKTTKKIAVLDRTKEPGAIGEPLYLDIVTALMGSEFAGVKVVGGRYGLGSKDTTPGQIIAVYDNLKTDAPKHNFTIGINDDVTHLSLPITVHPETASAGTTECKFWGLGSDGTVGANKNSIKIIGDHTDMYAQAYFQYDSKKSGGVTISHLRFGKSPIRSTYYVNKADFVACHNTSYVDKYDMTKDLKEGSSFLLNADWDVETLTERLPAKMKKDIASKKINFYTVDGNGIAKEIGLGNRINMILQSAFFKIANIIPLEDAVKYMKDAVVKSYGRKGEQVVNQNFAAIDKGIENVKKVDYPASWADSSDVKAKVVVDAKDASLKEFVEDILIPANNMAGDDIPVSTFTKWVDGTLPQGTAAYEKRGAAVDVPSWIPENCIQCNQCSYVCPHAVLRPFILDENELKAAPSQIKTKKTVGKGLDNTVFTMAASILDCTGCGSCVNVCPAKEKALVMQPIDTQRDQQPVFDYAFENVSVKETPFAATTVKGSQFKQPLLEFSGACGGCGETPYAKLITQLFGDRMYIANATGCSSIWGGSAPSTPYTVNKAGHGPAWANSLFEENAEYGYGMFLAVKQRRDKLADVIKSLGEKNADLKAVCDEWIENRECAEGSKAAAEKLLAAIGDCDCCEGKYIRENKDMLVKKSMWIFGGDGWAYDIGFGGLDHVIASGEDVNIMVFDTEVYSNTGGQASKATPTGSVAQFAAAGKGQKKKDLAAIAMSYGYVYVASIAMGADYNQTIKALAEAESYHGPSIIIAYAPCINHGIKGGLKNAMAETKSAVNAGYWNMFRYDPRLADEGKNPFTLDSKAPTASFSDFIKNEVRYSSLNLSFPDRAGKLFEKAEIEAKQRFDKLVGLNDK